jgi:bifunctional DNA-binding transcriptional regulator/antitoxin component of YhaV-PrlF toxin-antitoxin module
MAALKITVGGTITFPQDFLKYLGVQPGDKISVEKLSGGRIELKAVSPRGQISDAFDFLKRENGPSLSIEEINQFAAEGWAGKR